MYFNSCDDTRFCPVENCLNQISLNDIKLLLAFCNFPASCLKVLTFSMHCKIVLSRLLMRRKMTAYSEVIFKFVEISFAYASFSGSCTVLFFRRDHCQLNAQWILVRVHWRVIGILKLWTRQIVCKMSLFSWLVHSLDLTHPRFEPEFLSLQNHWSRQKNRTVSLLALGNLPQRKFQYLQFKVHKSTE